MYNTPADKSLSFHYDLTPKNISNYECLISISLLMALQFLLLSLLISILTSSFLGLIAPSVSFNLLVRLIRLLDPLGGVAASNAEQTRRSLFIDKLENQMKTNPLQISIQILSILIIQMTSKRRCLAKRHFQFLQSFFSQHSSVELPLSCFCPKTAPALRMWMGHLGQRSQRHVLCKLCDSFSLNGWHWRFQASKQNLLRI